MIRAEYRTRPNVTSSWGADPRAARFLFTLVGVVFAVPTHARATAKSAGPAPTEDVEHEAAVPVADSPPGTAGTGEIDELMFAAASRVRAGQVEEAIELAVRAMSVALRSGDVAGEERIAVLVARWSWEAYAASGDLEHLERAERSVGGVSASAGDPRVLEMAADLRVLIAKERKRLADATERRAFEPQEPRSFAGAGTRPSKPDSDTISPRSSRATTALVVTGAVGMAGAIGLVAAGGAFFRGLPGLKRVKEGQACTNCRSLGIGYTIGAATLAAGSAALLGVGIRRLIQARRGRLRGR